MSRYTWTQTEQPFTRCECMDHGPNYSNAGNPHHDGSPDECPDCHQGERPAVSGDRVQAPCPVPGCEKGVLMDDSMNVLGIPGGWVGYAECGCDDGTVWVTLTEDAVKMWSCRWCGYHSGSTSRWCDAGCGSDYNQMTLTCWSCKGEER